MHGNNEIGSIKLAALFRVGEVPYPAEDFIRQSRTLKYLLCRFPYAYQ
jgi:hypothetical protein